MKNDFNELLQNYKSKFKYVYDSSNLEELRDRYAEYSISKENVTDWILTNTEADSEEYDRYFKNLDKAEYVFVSEFGIPIFDDVESEELEQVFDDHTSYFQRYGCMDFEQVISWNNTNVLYEDEIGNCEIITRPDVLMKQSN
jgi:hypothetical protein